MLQLLHPLFPPSQPHPQFPPQFVAAKEWSAENRRAARKWGVKSGAVRGSSSPQAAHSQHTEGIRLYPVDGICQQLSIKVSVYPLRQ